MSVTPENQIRRRIAKPVGVYIITLFDFMAVGVVPLIGIIWLNRQPEVEIPFANFVVGVGLAVLTMAASVWALVGDNPGRYLVLALVTLSSLLMIINSVSLMASGLAEGPDAVRAVGAVVRAVFWIGINWWYFNRRHVVAFYKQNA